MFSEVLPIIQLFFFPMLGENYNLIAIMLYVVIIVIMFLEMRNRFNVRMELIRIKRELRK